jgi:NosR/NirI family transcriptional regulator, nitrous oxide reductase regulator
MLFSVAAAYGVERFPPPEFEGGYKMPPTTVPSARATWMEYVDVGALLAALSLASWFSLKQRSRKSVFVLMLGSLLYFGFYRKGCICPVGSIQDVTLALFQHSYVVPVTVVAFFLLPLIFALFFGRTFCAAVCPLGAMQDAVLVKPLKVRPWLEQTLGILPFLYLGLAVLFAATGSAFVICQYDPFVAFFRRSGSFNMFVLGAAFLAVGLFYGRPYCRFLCPYGALLSLLSRFSQWKVILSPNDCLQCKICDTACPYGAISEPAAAATAGSRKTRQFRVIVFSLMLPALMLAGGWGGNRLSVRLSQKHPTVQLAEQIAAEDAGKTTVPTDASKAFRQTGRAIQELIDEALQARRQFVIGGWILGAFVGLVFGAKLIALWGAQPADVYEPDPASCVACGRCYTYCPKVIVQLKQFNRKKVIPLTPV